MEGNSLIGSEFLIFEGKGPSDALWRGRYEALYRHWHETWSREFRRVKNPNPLFGDDFLRQDFLFSIWAGEAPAAYVLSTVFDLSMPPVRDHRYFSIFDEEAFSRLRDLGVRKAMTLEFLTVPREFRKRTCGVQLAAVISGLALKALPWVGADAAIAPAKKLTNVDELSLVFGAEIIKRDVYRGGIHCDLIAVPAGRVREFPEPGVRELTDRLWTARGDFTGRLTDPARDRIAA